MTRQFIPYDSQRTTPTEYAAELIQREFTSDEVAEILKQQKIVYPSINEALLSFSGKKNMSYEALADFSGINKATIYKIANRKLNPGRNVLLRIAFALHLSLAETQVLLKAGQKAQLSASKSRDLIIMDGIIHEKFVDDVNKELANKEFPDLNAKG